MAETSTKRADVDSHGLEPVANRERPAKRAKIDRDVMDASADQDLGHVDTDEDEEVVGQTLPPAADLRSSDLYLDTVSGFLRCCKHSLTCGRLTDMPLTLTLKKFALCLSPTSTFMGVLCAASTSKGEDAALMLMLTQYTMTIMSSFTWKPPK